MGWREEFGESYDVPIDIDRVFGLVDVSWHNDICPSFTDPRIPSNGLYDLRLWVEHPEPEQRQDREMPRYLVTDPYGADTYTDDVMEACAELVKRAEVHLSEVARSTHYTGTANGRPACDAVGDLQGTTDRAKVTCCECKQVVED